MLDKQYTVILFYKYVTIENPVELMNKQRELCLELGLKGRIIIASEGVNCTLEGETENIEKYILENSKDSVFDGIVYKKSQGDGNVFPKLSVKVRSEIVAINLGDQDFSPKVTTGKYLSSEQLHDWIHKDKKEFFIVDMRNYYEYKIGHFEGSLFFPGMSNFRDLPNVVDEIKHLKDKTILTVCTGGIRCEKASGFLVKHGFEDVYQLKDGIVTYMEKYPNEDFKGKLYVFDGRAMMGFNVDSPEHEVVGRCEWCGKQSENFVNHLDGEKERRHAICCPECIATKDITLSQRSYYSFR